MGFCEVLFNTKNERRCGNHRAKVEYCGTTKAHINFFYFDSCICRVDFYDKTFALSDCGWNTISTHCAMEKYKTFFEGKGFRLKKLYLTGFYGLPRSFWNGLGYNSTENASRKSR